LLHQQHLVLVERAEQQVVLLPLQQQPLTQQQIRVLVAVVVQELITQPMEATAATAVLALLLSDTK
jgi:hypothetical protein